MAHSLEVLAGLRVGRKARGDRVRIAVVEPKGTNVDPTDGDDFLSAELGVLVKEAWHVERPADHQRAPRRDRKPELARALAHQQVEPVPLVGEAARVVGDRVRRCAVHCEAGDREPAAAEVGNRLDLPQQLLLRHRRARPPREHERPVARLRVLAERTPQLLRIGVDDRPVGVVLHSYVSCPSNSLRLTGRCSCAER